jgi:hypothetical protein
VGVQVRWDRHGSEPAGKYTLLYGKENQRKPVFIKLICKQQTCISVFQHTNSVNFLISSDLIKMLLKFSKSVFCDSKSM